jgi:hypothetical protein
MTERTYRLIIGLSLLAMLYADSSPAVYGLIALMVLEAVTNWRIPLLVSRPRTGAAGTGDRDATGRRYACKFGFESERALRLVFAAVLLVTYVLFNRELWLFPWFAGFALTVAGLSGICPMLLFLEKVGFRPEGGNMTVNAEAN